LVSCSFNKLLIQLALPLGSNPSLSASLFPFGLNQLTAASNVCRRGNQRSFRRKKGVSHRNGAQCLKVGSSITAMTTKGIDGKSVASMIMIDPAGAQQRP
jgi:hypothetical protein